MRFSERYKIIPLVKSADVTTNGFDTKSINAGLLHELCFIINFGAITADDVLKVYTGAATATKTTAIAFKYRHAAADTGSALSDTFGAATSVASTGLTLTAATFDNKVLLVEIDCQAIDDAVPWVTLEVAGSATTENVGVVAIGRPRFSSNSGLPSVI